MSTKLKPIGVAVIAVALVAGGVLFALWPGASEFPADPTDPALVTRGQAVYAENCASCHGPALEGQPNWQQRLADGTMPAPPHDASGHTWHHPDTLLFQITKLGGQAVSPPGYANAMPAFGEILGDDDIWAVLAFIKSRWPDEVQVRQQVINDRAAN